ncbi:GRB2-associated-binding protein 3 isoform 6-T6 [Macrochelys suwanniensis]
MKGKEPPLSKAHKADLVSWELTPDVRTARRLQKGTDMFPPSVQLTVTTMYSRPKSLYQWDNSDAKDSVESLSHTTSSLQPSPAISTHTSRIADPSSSVGSATTDASASEETRSESESVFLPDYLFLSNCETGKFNHIRCDSWSNSDRSLEQTSSDDVFVDALQSQPSLHVQPSGNGVVHQDGGQPANHGILPRSIDVSGPFSDVSSSSPLLGPPLTPTFQIDKSQAALPYGVTELDILSNTPPPRPPKPTHFSDRIGEELSNGALQNGHGGICGAQIALVPRRISLSSLDNMRHWKASMEGSSLRSRDKRLSLNLPCRFSPLYSSASDNTEDSYVPMHPSTSPPIPASDCSPDGYTPMSPSSATFTFPVVNNDKLSSPLPELPTDLEPPPVNRDLKPRRKSRPPPLDLRNLSTIREHATLTRMWTVPYNRTSFISPDRDSINSARIFANSVSGEEEESYIQMEHSQATSPCSGVFPWSRKSNLDYLALDFNSASPSPVQKVRIIYANTTLFCTSCHLSLMEANRQRFSLLSILNTVKSIMLFQLIAFITGST